MPRRWVLRAVIALSFSTAVLSDAPHAQTPLSVRFHHVHYTVPDPAAAMSEAVRDLGARRMILPGLGVGVAVDEHYLLFDRSPALPSIALVSIGKTVDAARSWLHAMNIAVVGNPGNARWLETSDSRWLGHVAFAADDLAAVERHLAAQGFTRFRRSDESSMYRSRDGGVVEFVRDTDRPDAYWCPMHPDVRSSSAATCPLCSMALVPIPPPKLGDYRMDVVLTPSRAGTGAHDLRFTIRDPESGAIVDRFMEVHDRLFHLFVVSRDLSHFVHEHPAFADGRFELTLDLPPNAYMLIADFLPAGGTPQMVQQAIVTGRERRSFAPPPALRLDSPDKVVAGVHVRLTSNLTSGREGTLTFSLSDAATGAPIGNLEPFLGAPGHLLIVNPALTDAFHAHPGIPAVSGADLTFAQLLPSVGYYKLWLQFQRGGRVITVPFVIEVK
jgi:hypothetical protein